MKRRLLSWGFVAALPMSLLGIAFYLPHTYAESDQVCPSGYGVTQQNGTLSGQQSLYFSGSSAAPAEITRVIFLSDTTVLAEAQKDSTNWYSWWAMWFTNLSENKAHNVRAKVFHANGFRCITDAVSMTVYNSTSGSSYKLHTAATPSDWSGPTNFNIDIMPHSWVSDVNVDVTPYTVFEWSSSIGSITPIERRAKFSSGPVSGSGEVTVTARYAGRNITIKIPVQVFTESQTTENTTSPSTTTDSGTTTNSTNSGTGTNTTPQPTTTNPSAVSIESDTELVKCLVAAMGQARYDEINSGAKPPTSAEFDILRNCLARRNFVLPRTLAPVPPGDVKTKPESNTIKIADAENKKVQGANGERYTLVLSGKARAKSTVFIYIFSEPLILTTVADAEGNWTYQLEDPLEPGKHETYALVDKGDGTYERSAPFGFEIAKAQASAENPNGYSLQLQSDPTPSKDTRGALLYIAGSIGLVLVVIAVVLFIVLRRLNHKPSAPTPPFPEGPPAANSTA